MSQVGKYLNLKPHMQSWAVYNENGPYTTAYKIGSLAPAQFGGLSYKILAEKGNDVYVIQTESFGRCAIWAPRDNDSSITSSPAYSNGGSSSGGSTNGTGKYLNLKPHMQSWAVYNENGPYTTAHKIGSLAPAQFGGLSYEILAEKGNDVYVIQTETFGRCAIWAPRDNDSSITSSPAYSNGGSSSGGSTGGNTGNGGVEIPGGLKVFIDPGHGGSDPGAVGNGLQEKNIVLSISKKLGTILNSYGISVKYSRTNDTFVDLAPRAQMANNLGANLFVSIHTNAATASARGTECYTHPNDNSKTKNLSANISKSISSRLGIANRGHKEENFAVLRLTSMPAVLVETAFISNSSDANLLKNRQDDFANAIANQILSYFNISNKPKVHTINNGIGNLLNSKPYELQAFVNPSHKMTILSTKKINITLAAELIQDSGFIPLSTENYNKLQKMSNPKELFEGISGILFDMLPGTINTEIESLFNGIEKYEVNVGKISFTDKEITITALELSVILKYPNDVRVKETIAIEGKLNIDDFLKQSSKFALAIIAIIILALTPIDDIAAIIAGIWNIIKIVFS